MFSSIISPHHADLCDFQTRFPSPPKINSGQRETNSYLPSKAFSVIPVMHKAERNINVTLQSTNLVVLEVLLTTSSVTSTTDELHFLHRDKLRMSGEHALQ